ncbi:MAG: response regulator [Planctomycetes bacterium]|nr:response regulator [Planctomycetota bacterium]
MNGPVLLVDDDHDLREELTRLCELEGYRVLPAAHGAEARALLEAGEAPCVVVLDLMMPVMNGWELLAWLRAAGSPHRDLPVVLLSASTYADATGQAFDVQATLAKPVPVPTLLQTLAQHCRRSA